MATLASALRDETRRLARKEIRAFTGPMAQAISRYRHEIARLKRQLREHEKKLAMLAARERKRLGETTAEIVYKFRRSYMRLKNSSFLQQLAERDVTKRRLEPRRESFRLEIVLDSGIQRTSVLSCGTFTMED